LRASLTNFIKKEETQSKMKLSLLPLGTRFKYRPLDDTQFVLLSKNGCGLVAPWIGIRGNKFDSIYSAAESEEEFKLLEVEYAQ